MTAGQNRANVNFSIEQGGDYLRLGDQQPIFRKRLLYSDLMDTLVIGGNRSYVRQWDDFDGAAIRSMWGSANISSSSTVAVVSGAAAGAARLTTDVALNAYSGLTSSLSWLASKGVWFFTRAKQVSATTARIVEIGLSDALSETNGVAFSSHDASVVAVADDAAVFAFNTGESVTTYSALSVKAAGTPQSTTGVATPGTSSYTDFAISIETDGSAYFYVNGTLVATHTAAVATTAVLTPWIVVKNLTAATARSMDVDYVGIGGSR